MYSPARRRFLAGVALAAAAISVYLLWPVALHLAAKAILEAREVKLSKIAPDFTLSNAKGERLRLSSYKGKVVLLNFRATWCGPCKVEIPWFVEFQKTYQAQGLTVLGVSMDEDGWSVVNPYVASQKVNYPIVLGDERVHETGEWSVGIADGWSAGQTFDAAERVGCRRGVPVPVTEIIAAGQSDSRHRRTWEQIGIEGHRKAGGVHVNSADADGEARRNLTLKSQ